MSGKVYRIQQLLRITKACKNVPSKSSRCFMLFFSMRYHCYVFASDDLAVLFNSTNLFHTYKFNLFLEYKCLELDGWIVLSDWLFDYQNRFLIVHTIYSILLAKVCCLIQLAVDRLSSTKYQALFLLAYKTDTYVPGSIDTLSASSSPGCKTASSHNCSLPLFYSCPTKSWLLFLQKLIDNSNYFFRQRSCSMWSY